MSEGRIDLSEICSEEGLDERPMTGEGLSERLQVLLGEPDSHETSEPPDVLGRGSRGHGYGEV